MSRPSPQTDRLIALVDVLSQRPGEQLTLAEICRALGVGKATLHPMLSTLTRAGWLLRDPTRRTYRLGPALVAAGRAAAGGDTVLDLARPLMRDLVAVTGATCMALVPGDDPGGEQGLLVGELVRAPGEQPGNVRLGDRIRPRPPLGAVTVAWAAPHTVDAWLARLRPDDDPGVPDEATRTALLAALDGIRARGWAVEVEDDFRTRLAALVAELELDDALDTALGQGTGTPPRHSPYSAQAQVLRRALSDIGQAFDAGRALPATVEPGAQYRASSVNAPVFDDRGTVAAVLCLLPSRHEALPGSQVLELGKLVSRAAVSVTRALGGQQPGNPGSSGAAR